MKQKLETALRGALRAGTATECNPAHLEETANKARLALQAQTKQRPIGLFRFLLRQVWHVGYIVWGVQAVIIILACLVLSASYRGIPDSLARYFPVLLSCYAVMLSAVSIPLLYRSAKYHMLELEASTQASLPKLILANMILAGLGDIVAIALVLLLTGTKSQIGLYHALIYLLLPFLISCMGIFGLIEKRSVYVQAAYCIAVMLVFMVAFYFAAEQVLLWSILSALGIPVCIVQFRRMMRRVSAPKSPAFY